MSTSRSTVGLALFSSSAPSVSSPAALPAPNIPPATPTSTSWIPEPAADDLNNSCRSHIHISHVERNLHGRSPCRQRRGINRRRHASSRRSRRTPYPPRSPWVHGSHPRGSFQPGLPRRRAVHGSELLCYALHPLN